MYKNKNVSAPPNYDNHCTGDDSDVEEWDIINQEEIEREQINYIRNIIMETLYSEFAGNCQSAQIIQKMDINLKYRTIEITIKKINIDSIKDSTFFGRMKKATKKISSYMVRICGEIAITHPVKTLGLLTIILKLR